MLTVISRVLHEQRNVSWLVAGQAGMSKLASCWHSPFLRRISKMEEWDSCEESCCRFSNVPRESLAGRQTGARSRHHSPWTAAAYRSSRRRSSHGRSLGQWAPSQCSQCHPQLQVKTLKIFEEKSCLVKTTKTMRTCKSIDISKYCVPSEKLASVAQTSSRHSSGQGLITSGPRYKTSFNFTVPYE